MIPLPLKPKITSQDEKRAVFEIEGLYPGYGATIGNSLRRVLLSSLEGAAIVEVKIKGAPHEFSTLPGVLEDMVTLLLNLKKIRVKSFSQEPQTAILSVKGEKEVRAGDFKLTSEMEIVNPQIHIATLTKSSSELSIEVKVVKGVGYEPTEMRVGEKNEVGVLPLDAIFTPIVRVSFSVENMRVGKRTDFDKLIMEIETDGTVSPKDAFEKSAQILVDHFSLMNGQDEKKGSEIEPEKIIGAESAVSEEIKKMKVEDLKISERTKNALTKSGIKTVGGLSRKSEEALLAVEGLGEKGKTEVKKALKKLGL